jgi:arylsulfatase
MKRREFLKVAGAAATAASFPRYAHTPKANAALSGKRPNIILIMADDMGYSDIGCYGGEIETPNIDKLAANGIRFAQFYNAARCCPTRASLLTGLYAHQAGIGHMTAEELPEQNFDTGHDGYRGFLNHKCVTIAEALKPAGYHTLMSGKWHAGTWEDMWPTDRGFDEFFGIIRGASNFWNPAPNKLLLHNKERIKPWDGFYTTDAFTDHAIDSITVASQADDDPFFCYLSYTAPHWPLHAHDKDIAKYRGKYMKGWTAIREERYARMIEKGLVYEDWPLSDQDAPRWDHLREVQKDECDLRMATYAAQVDCMDQNIGRLIDHLEELGELDNTLIMFFADNGACAEDEDDVFGSGPIRLVGSKEGYYVTYGRAWANASNTPYRQYKHWVHEGGIASPLVVHWPDHVKPDDVWRQQPGHLIDLMATCLDAAGADYPTHAHGNAITPLEGISLLPAFANQSLDREAIYFEHEGNRAVRTDEWKLVAGHKEPWQLYNMKTDRTEENDLAKKHPELRDEMIAMYEAWVDRCGVLPWPVRRKEGFTPPKREYPKTYVDLGL